MTFWYGLGLGVVIASLFWVRIYRHWPNWNWKLRESVYRYAKAHDWL